MIAPNRFWTAPDGTLWRLWLAPAPRHRVRQGDRRPTLTFVDMGNPSRQEVRMVPEGTELEGMGEQEMEGLILTQPAGG